MAEVTAHTITLPVNNTLPEAQVIQLERSIATAEAPEIRKTRANLLSARLENHVKKIGEHLSTEQIDFKKITETLKYFNTRDESIGMSPVERIAKIYESLDVPTDAEERRLFDDALQKHMFFLERELSISTTIIQSSMYPTVLIIPYELLIIPIR